MNILAIYNICGILHDNTEKYIPYLQSIVDQKFDGKIIVSACMPRSRTIPALRERFPEIDFVSIDQNLPVNITFNFSVLRGIEKYGNFDSYAYISCDSYCTQPNQLAGLYEIMKNHESCGLVCPRLLRDSGYAFGLRMGAHRLDDYGASLEMFQYGDYVIPVGRAVNAHTLLYSHKIQEYYGKCCPDIFKGFCTESVLSFVCGAVNANWIISKDIIMGHDVGMDTPSAGQGVQEHAKTRPTHDHPFMGDSLLPVFFNEEAKRLGLGYEECQGVLMHDPNQWTDNGFCRNDSLKEYIKNNLYLTESTFDYGNINGSFV